MSPFYPKILGAALSCALMMCAEGCKPPRPPEPSVNELLDDRVTLDGIVIKCNNDRQFARSSGACASARIAVERIAAQKERAEAAKRQAEFELHRDRLRESQDRLRQQQELYSHIDAYHLPLVPVDPPADLVTQPKPPLDVSSPMVGQADP